jgi:hypothetical protein
MTESSHVALKLSELIRNHFQGVTKQKKIVELLKDQGIEVSEGLLSRLFNGFYEVRLDSRLFAELSQLFAPEESKEVFWDRLLKDYNPNTVLNESIKIGLSLKSFWARPFVALMAEDSLPTGFEMVYGRRVKKTLNENKHVITSKTEIEKVLSGRQLSIPPDPPKENEEERVGDEQTLHNDELYLNQSLVPLLKKGEIDLLVSPASIHLQKELDIIPIARIGAGFATQCIIISSVPEIDYTLKVEALKEEEKSGRTIKTHPFSNKGHEWVAFYHNYIAGENNKQRSDSEYLRRLISEINVERLFTIEPQLKKEDGTNDYFWIRTLENTLTTEAWTKFLAILSQQCKSTGVPDNLKEQYEKVFENFKTEDKKTIVNKLIQKHETEAKYWQDAYELLSQRISKPISLFSESYPYEYQIRQRVVNDVLLNGGTFALVAFSPFNNKVVSDIVAHFDTLQNELINESKYKNYRLLIQRFNLSHIIGEKDIVYLYGTKDYLKSIVQNKQLPKIHELLTKLRQATEDLKHNHSLIEKLAFHHFFFEKEDFLDSPEEITKKRDWFYKKPEYMKKLIEEYLFAEQYNDFSYKVFRNDEYARFLEEMLSEK